MYIAVIRKDNRVWKTIVLRNKLDDGVIMVDGEKVVVKLSSEVGNRLIYDVDELSTFEVWLGELF